jgi:tetratricopeptide (TPR) repeat protein
MTTERARRLADGLLAVVPAGLAFLLGCHELFDGDIWWHLRTGRWIIENRAIPRVDQFTFGSEGRPWVDLHWTFQVAMATAEAAGGAAGVILLAAAVGAAAILVGVGGRGRDWPAWVVAAAWLPGLILASSRFDPRPEVLTLLCLSAFLAILPRARRRPGWLWLLVPIQVLWVNAHGLFVLGPWSLGLFLLDRAALPAGMPPWRRLLPPSLAVGAACLANPYGLRGLLFPLELFPKLTEGGGSYKSYIGEFMSPRMMIAAYPVPAEGYDLYLRLFASLLAALPVAFLVPALWRAWSSASARPEDEADGGLGSRAGDLGHPRGEDSPAWVGAWAGGLAVALAPALAVGLGLAVRTTPAWRVGLGRSSPWMLAASGLLAAVLLGRRSRFAAALAVAGAGASAGWVAWLNGYLSSVGPSPAAAAVALGLGLPAAWLTIRAGARPSGPLLAASFAYLGLLSVRNMSLFGLVAGAVLAAELGEWAARLGRGASSPGRARATSWAWAGLAARLAVLGVLGLLCALTATGRSLASSDDYRRLGLRERPFYFAHDASRFAARPGLPDRVLAFGLDQAAVYVFHNGPARKVFMDGRLEVASRSTFEQYAWVHYRLTEGDPRWSDVVRRMGDPLILIDHEDNAAAEATLLADPRWRCVYQDAVVALFLPRGRSGPDLERAYPTVDFAGRHFRRPVSPATPAGPGASYAEGRALVRVAAALGYRPAPAWSLRIPLSLVALDRARAAIAETPGGPGPWTILGHAVLALAPGRESGPGARPIGPDAPWDPALGLPWAQASTAYREALRRAPANEATLRSLSASFAMRRMDDARRALEARLPGSGTGPNPGTDANRTTVPPRPWPGDGRLADTIDDLLRQGRPASAVAMAAEAGRRGRALPWATAERVAGACLHLGEPSQARRAWLEADAPPSSALLAARVADADLAAWDLDAAEAGYRRALTLDPDLADAWVGLALIGLERGHSAEALQAGRAALPSTTEPRRRSMLEGIVSLSEPYARRERTSSAGPRADRPN